jgi:hypothetical protein
MADTTKLSVGKAIEKLRGTETAKTRMTRLDEKTEQVDEEIRRLRAARGYLERSQRSGSTKKS